MSVRHSSNMSLLRTTIKITRIFGVFPLNVLPDGTLVFKWLSIPTVCLALTVFLYTLPTLDYAYAAYHAVKHADKSLSEQFVIYPTPLAMIISDLVIHAGCALQSSQISKLVRTLDRLSHCLLTAQKGREVHLVYVLLLLYVISSVFHLAISSAVIHWGATSLFFCPERCRGYYFISWLYYFADVVHDGVVGSAAGFVVIFGKRLVDTFNGLCITLRNYCLDKDVDVPRSVEHDHDSGKVGHVELFVRHISELQGCFEIYSSVAGMCILMLLLEAYTMLFCVLGSTFIRDFGERTTVSHVWLITYIYMSLLMIVLLTETGHYMHNKVSKSQWAWLCK